MRPFAGNRALPALTAGAGGVRIGAFPADAARAGIGIPKTTCPARRPGRRVSLPGADVAGPPRTASAGQGGGCNGESPVTEARLNITGPEGRWEEPLEPGGAVVGRSRKCDVRLPDPVVSNRHARIFRDPRGRWIVEDLGSTHGVWSGGGRIDARALLPGEQFQIHPYTLSVSAGPGSQIAPEASAGRTSALLGDEGGSKLTVVEAAAGRALTGDRIRQLNEISDRLVGLAGSGELYPTVCRHLAETPDSAAAVVRLPAPDRPLPDSPELLTCRFAGAAETAGGSLRMSRRVLEAVRRGGSAVMASDLNLAEGALDLTVVDPRRPRSVFCAPVNDPGGSADVLYLDVPADHGGPDAFDFFRAVARQVALARKALLLAEERSERQVLDRELARARDIQLGLIATAAADLPGIDVAFHYQPALWGVGGDYCDLWPLADGRAAFAVGDVMGKGLAAAMVMTNLHAALRVTTSFRTAPAEVMDRVSAHLARHMEGMMVTFFLGLFEPATGRLEFVNAGHMPPLLVGPDGRVADLHRPQNAPLGVNEGPFTADAACLPPGACLVLVTDGILESRRPDGEEFGTERLRQLLAATPAGSARTVVDAVTAAAADFRQSQPRPDDITVLALIHRPS